jgi:hypothetical protein
MLWHALANNILQAERMLRGHRIEAATAPAIPAGRNAQAITLASSRRDGANICPHRRWPTEPEERAVRQLSRNSHQALNLNRNTSHALNVRQAECKWCGHGDSLATGTPCMLRGQFNGCRLAAWRTRATPPASVAPQSRNGGEGRSCRSPNRRRTGRRSQPAHAAVQR